MRRMAAQNKKVHASCSSSNLEDAFHYDDCYFFMVDITYHKRVED
jgi:hypothetical protein